MHDASPALNTASMCSRIGVLTSVGDIYRQGLYRQGLADDENGNGTQISGLVIGAVISSESTNSPAQLRRQGMRNRFLTFLAAALLAGPSFAPAFAAGGGSGASAGAGSSSAGASTGGTAQGAGTTTGGVAEQPGTGQGTAPDTSTQQTVTGQGSTSNTQTTGQSQPITGLPPSNPTEAQARRNQGAGTAPNGQPLGSPGSGLGSPEQPLNSGRLSHACSARIIVSSAADRQKQRLSSGPQDVEHSLKCPVCLP